MKENTFELKLTESELNAVINALAQMPYGQVYQLIARINQQAVEQLKSKEV